MPISVVRLPPPALERSLVPYTVNMVNRICDALLKAFGGDFQTGTTSFAATGLANIAYNVLFPATFGQATGPIVVCVPTGSADQWAVNIGFTNNNAFSIWANVLGVGAATGPFNAKWVAWYP